MKILSYSVALALAFLACVGNAGANVPTRAVRDGSLFAAYSYWNGALPPCGVLPTVRVVRLPWRVLGRTTMGGCEILLNRRRPWRGYTHALEACATIAHEYGHDLFVPHSADDTGLMAEHDDGTVPRQCFALVK